MKKSLSIIAMSTALLLPAVTAEASQPEVDSAQPVKVQVEGTAYKAIIHGQPIRWEGGKWNELDLNKLIQQILNSNSRPSVQPPVTGDQHVQQPETPKPEAQKPEAPKPEKPETQKPETQNPAQKPDTEKPSDQPQANPQAPGATEQPSAQPPAKPQQPEQTAPEKPAAGQNAGLSAFEQQVLDLTNAERTKAGLKPLAADAKLMDAAREKSADMSKNNYFSHTSPTLGSPFDRMKALGISYRSAAENIAMGQRSPEEVVKAWMDSPGHRQNILTPGFTHIGIGYDANGHYWTQQFIQK
ncbi:CAP domain-containing protein [Bhargavaea ullalensis]|uniref:YkwD family protein n=1 Tax=Bhargavaea ullalensis TaxID=1265685 RepID=A0ABV2G9D6_9BACL